MARTAWRDAVPLHERAVWTVPQLAGVCGYSDGYLYDRLEWDSTGQAGVIRLPGGVTVPVYKDPNGDAVVYRRQFEAAVEAAPSVHVTNDPNDFSP